MTRKRRNDVCKNYHSQKRNLWTDPGHAAMYVKAAMLKWVGNSGIKKAEFFRLALMIRTMKLSNRINAKSPDEGYREEEVLQETACT